MRRNEVDIFILIASIFVGILISTNISVKTDKNVFFLTAKQYQDATNEKNKLLNDIAKLKKQYDNYYRKYMNYKYSDDDNKTVLKDIQNELNQNKILMGMKDVEGPGIVIKIEDAIDEFNMTYDPVYLIHDVDILFLINDLKSAGAEAISVNGQRIIDGSYDYCGGAFIDLNGVKIVAPYYISAIGNVDLIKKYMLSDENYLKELMIVRKIKVDVKTYENLKINGYIGEKRYKYARPVIN